MDSLMENVASGDCSHPDGVWAVAGARFQCPRCRARLDLEGIERWVREAERVRDEVYLMIEGDDSARAADEEHQREVYRRRKVLYELNQAPRGLVARPEMILVSYDVEGDAYGCRIFYKEPRPPRGTEYVSVAADLDGILALHSHPDPNVRLACAKLEEFHSLREGLLAASMPPPPRRVYYSSEF